MTNLKEIEQITLKFESNVDLIAKELKRVQSIKCRLKKCKGKSSYTTEMTEVLKYEQVLKEARNLLDPTEKPVTMFEQDDVDQLDYDETIKAIRSIQSKKTLTKWLTTVECDNDEYRNAVRIEKMLIERRESTKPVEETNVRKTDVQTIIDTIESSGKLSQEKILELLKNLVWNQESGQSEKTDRIWKRKLVKDMAGIKKFTVYSQIRSLRQMVGDRLDADDFKGKDWNEVWDVLQNLECKLENMNLKEDGED